MSLIDKFIGIQQMVIEKSALHAGCVWGNFRFLINLYILDEVVYLSCARYN